MTLQEGSGHFRSFGFPCLFLYLFIYLFIYLFQSTDTKNYQERMYAVAGICCGNLRHLELRTVYV